MKTNMIELLWNGEVVDSTSSKKEAQFLKNEYEIAFGEKIDLSYE